ncbi:Diguanylate cyclase [Candidatus Desulfarcum epimagneticum]|uniref:Diguanylate cyclase n=1 Tax=uncultured Desulfobacteraceae bacterium TaxID=218296 RepID=A0A484HJC5_9BACT|nr:Diguanylate cyclase [uncultured Desulfobacteraceae bacterium]
MTDLSTQYLGMELRNPLIAGSSGLTGSLEKVKKMEESGAGAVVLKSIFEEEIAYEYSDFIEKAAKSGPAPTHFEYEGRQNPIEYYDYKIREDNLNRYVQLVEDTQKALSVPVIASVNCYLHSADWVSYARYLEQAGADAIELNMFFPPTHFKREKRDMERLYFEVTDKILKEVSIPAALKISHYFTDLGPMILKLSRTGVKGLVLFNRFFSPDFDIEEFKVIPSFVLSDPSELAISLRWMSIMAQKVECDLAASTGVHDGDALIKHLLAGAAAVQVASCLYKNGPEYIGNMLEHLRGWMVRKGFSRLSDFKGKMSQDKSADPAVYERVQFMKYFGGKKNVRV